MRIEDSLAPMSVETFVTEHVGTRYLRLEGEAGRFARLLSWASLNDLLARLRVSGDRVRVVRDGRRVPPEEYLSHPDVSAGSQLRSHAIHRMLSQGATLVADAVEEMVPEVRTLAESLEDVFRVHVGVNLYAGFRRQHGFDLHWDDHDTLILQVAGRKHWRVFEPTRPHPLRSDVAVASTPAPDATPVWDGLLEDGALLYMPRGWWHVATPVDEPSLHLTFGLSHQTGADFLDWIATRMKARVETRQDLPHWAPIERQQSYLTTLAEGVRALLAETSLDDYMAWHEARTPLRPAFSLPVVDGAPTWLGGEGSRVWLAGSRRLWLRGSRSGELVFDLSGKPWRCAPTFRPALALLSRAPRPVADLLASIDPADRPPLKTLLAAMVAAGELHCDASPKRVLDVERRLEGHPETRSTKSRETRLQV